MIYELLGTGEENAKSGAEICKALNIHIRDLTEAITRERRAGAPICATTGRNPGYFIAANKEEMQLYCNKLYHRAGEIFKTRRACLNTIEKLPPREG